MAEDSVTRASTNKIMTLVLVCFFFSGLTGLIYEILWIRMIVKVIGGAPFAVSIVLTVFMGGLGLGSFLAGRTIDRMEEPIKLVRIYGLLELVIGVYGLVLPLLLSAFKPLYAILYNHLFAHFLLYSFLTFIGCAVLLCIPVICMGATLPILCRFYVTRLSHLGTHAGRLYGLNTIGAAAGALLCGFWLINLLGVRGTLALAVSVNVIIGLSCIFGIKKVKTAGAVAGKAVSDPDESSQKAAAVDTKTPEYPGEINGALVIFAVSGFCAMAYEVIWTKLLGLIVGPTTYSFTIVLVTFILGLALGSMIFGRLGDRTKKVIWLLIFTQIVAALSVLGISQLLGNSQLFFTKLIFQFKDQFALLSLVKAVILFAFMILPTLCLGATFPLVGKIYTRSGAVSGSFCAGFILIPLVGKENGLSLVIGLQLLTALIVAGMILLKSRKGIVRFVPLAVPALAGIFLCLDLPQWNHRLLATGKYHRFEGFEADIKKSSWLTALLKGPEILTGSERGQLVYYGDGIGGFTTVKKYTGPLGNVEFAMANSGKVDASSRGDMNTQTLSAHFPMLFHKDPKEVMVLGLASGITAGEVLLYPVEQLDVIDINDQVVKASDFFIPWNSNVLSDPRTRLIIQDGRAHLNLTNKKYDVIISEPSNPWMAGLAALFTRDFFALAKGRLNQGGIFVQFLHSYQMDWPTFALVGRTFARVFQSSLLVVTRPSTIGKDYLLVGFKGRGNLVLDHARQKITHTRQSKNVSLSDPRLFYRLVVSEDLKELFGRGPVNTDSMPLLEFAAPRQLYRSDTTIRKIIKTRKKLSIGTSAIVRQVTTDVDAQIDYAAYALSLYSPFKNMVDLTRASASQKERFFKLMETYYVENPLDASLLKDDDLIRRCRLVQIKTIEDKIDRVPDRALSYAHLGRLYLAENMLDEAMAIFRRVLQIEPDHTAAYNYLGVALARQGKLDKAITHFKEALRIDPDYAQAHNSLGSTLKKQGKVEEAITHFREAVRINPDFAKAHQNIGSALARLGRLDESVREYQKALRMDPENPDIYNELGVVLSRQGNAKQADRLFARAEQISPSTVNKDAVLGRTLFRQGKLEQAVKAYRRALEMAPDSANIHNELGFLQARQGRFDEAVIHLEKALRVKPGMADAHVNLGRVLLRQGKIDEAVIHLEKALHIKPGLVDTRINLGRILNRRGKFDQAAIQFEEALKIRPDIAGVQADVGRILLRQGRLEQAATHLKKALQIEPDMIGPMNNLAWILATHKENRVREPDEAIRLAQRACDLTNNKRPDLLDTLAAAYAAAGRFSDAVEAAEKALKLAQSSGQNRLAEEIQKRRLLFKAGQPYIHQ